MKRLFDIVGALLGLIVLTPVGILLALLVVVDSGGPILHRRRVVARQTLTPGQVPRTFFAFKFRTMRPDADEVLLSDSELLRRYRQEFKLPDDPRVTRLGRFLRRASLDELPQLWNVLRGEMTLVGPRMISPPEVAMYGDAATRLLSVKPGLTGLWQVSGRHQLPYAERVCLDLWYIEHRSFGLDVSILLRTIWAVLTGKGAY